MHGVRNTTEKLGWLCYGGAGRESGRRREVNGEVKHREVGRYDQRR
jgi:hypothetical protein